MPLWNTTDANTTSGKPNWYNAANTDNIYATDRGWELTQGGGVYTDMHGNTRKKTEILVASADNFAGANATHNLANATITAVQMGSTTLDVNGVSNVVVTWNEEVTVIGAPTLTVTVANTTSNVVPATVTATYFSGNNTNRLSFRFTAYSNAATYTIPATGVAISNTSAEIKDVTANSVNAELFVFGYFTGANSRIGTLTAS